MLVGMSLVLACARPARSGDAHAGAVPLLLIMMGVVLAATKALLDPGVEGNEEAWVLAAQAAFLVVLALPRTRLEVGHAQSTSSNLLPVLGLTAAAAMAAVLDPADQHQKKLLRCTALCLPWVAASVLRRCSPFDSASGFAVALLPAAVFLSQAEKGPVLAAACFAAPLALDRRAALSRRLAGTVVLLTAAAIAWDLVLRAKGYDSVSDYFATRVMKEQANEVRLLGMVADGHRLELWDTALQQMTASPILGMPLGAIADQYGFDEHNSFVFFLARTGACGVIWAALYVLTLGPRIDHVLPRSATSIARACALLPMLAFASVGNFFNDGDYLLAIALASRLAPRGVSPLPNAPSVRGRRRAKVRPPSCREREAAPG